jgi:hypothetical protein
MYRNAIIVLTKGYSKNEDYKKLINRNKSIYDIFYSKIKNKKEYDIVLYHEGNITINQQKWLQKQTPDLPLIFKVVKFIEFDKNIKSNYCIPTKLSEKFSNGYKNMCQFWSVDLFKYVKDYNYIIRIDEDCILKNISTNIINEYIKNKIYYSSAYFQSSDSKDVTIGIEQFFRDINNGKKYGNIKFPYTNFFIMNVQYFLKNTKLINALSKINYTHCIFINRWGDLPIWGYLLKYYVPSENYIEDKNISYLHESHNIIINNKQINIILIIFIVILICVIIVLFRKIISS